MQCTPVEQQKQDPLPLYPLSDAGNAERFVRDHGANARHLDDSKRWVLWGGDRWAADRTRAVEHLALTTVRRLHLEASQADVASAGKDPLAKALLAHARRSHGAKPLANMVALARSFPVVRATPEMFDADGWALNVLNGTIDLRTGVIGGHRRGSYITKLCPTFFDSAADCPAWELFLLSIFGDDERGLEVITFVQRLFGYALTGDTSEHLLPVFWGGGGNGKSTFLEVVMGVMGGEYAMKAPQNLLMAKDGETHPTERADLAGMRLVCATETDDGRRLSEALVKELTGGDAIRARRMRENFFQFSPTHKLILCTNHKPRTRGTDNGLWRRLRLVPFSRQFWNPDVPPQPGECRDESLRADKGLKEKLLAERSGILTWMVRGCLDWQRHGLGTPEAVSAATSDYRAEENIIGRFIEERCEKDGVVKSGVLYTAFQAWCTGEGMKDVPSPRSFGLAMTEAGYVREKTGREKTTAYKGLRVRSEIPD